MTTDGRGTDDGGTARRAQPPQVFMALPEHAEDRREAFSRCLADVARLLRLDVPARPEPGPVPGGERAWEHRVRTALRAACRRGLSLSEESFDVLLRAAVHDPDPSFDRQFVEPALNAFGYRRVRAALLRYLRTGTDPERAGAARAWYWTALPLRMPLVRAEEPRTADREEPEDGRALVAKWHQAALREFVENEHLDVRRSILPELPLRTSAYPPELHDLVHAAVAIARSHPDAYIRHRVEHQVGDGHSAG
ncbi:hypothetical protein [Streptomyces sp. MI02-7b]|uniref:hypothetical protein n=1 Tax=Streptomyces sp. MI02-7b TaxID=462941 RepID=UPI0029AD1A17|nr:hypothetical protein [Streptomyces sp. MI02-7b]MDX3073332.1 hypothetical protein [Streptomyces sp. MI02-7b]